MAENNTVNTTTPSSGGNAGMAFIVGALVVVVGVMAYFMFDGDAGGSDDVNISIEGAAEPMQDAAEAVEGAAESATDGN